MLEISAYAEERHDNLTSDLNHGGPLDFEIFFGHLLFRSKAPLGLDLDYHSFDLDCHDFDLYYLDYHNFDLDYHSLNFDYHSFDFDLRNFDL